MASVIPELKRVHCPDEEDLDTARSYPARATEIFVQAMFGPANSAGEESFGFVLYNEPWFLEQSLDAERLPSHYLLIETFDDEIIRKRLQEIANGCDGKDWHEAAKKLSALSLWEFDGYNL